jgi:hypothetical protein
MFMFLGTSPERFKPKILMKELKNKKRKSKRLEQEAEHDKHQQAIKIFRSFNSI